MWKDILSRLPVSIRGAAPFDTTPDDDDFVDDLKEPAAQNLWVPYALTAFLLLLLVGGLIAFYVLYF